jgi:predicted nucleic acid-binding protein
MTAERPLLLDHEAVQALLDTGHRRHRRVALLVEATAASGRRRGRPAPVVPTAVRVEAAWDRRHPRAASINRFAVGDAPLDGEMADRAARLVTELRVSVADAHLGATLAAVGECTVVTSDVDDVRRMADHLDVPVRIVRV